MDKHRSFLCAAFAALALSACGGGSPTSPTSGPGGPVPDPIATVVTALSTEGNVVPSATVSLPDGRTIMTDGAGIANLGTPLPAIRSAVRIEAAGYLGYGMGGRIVRFGIDDEPPGSGRYTLQRNWDASAPEFIKQTNYTSGAGMPTIGLGKAPGPLTFRNRDNDPRIDIALFEQGYRDWVAAGCDTNGGAPVVVEVWIDPNDPTLDGAVARTRDNYPKPGVWATTILYSEREAHELGTIKHEIGWAHGFTYPPNGITVGRTILSNTRGVATSDITDWDRANCNYRAHRRERNKWVDDATNAR